VRDGGQSNSEQNKQTLKEKKKKSPVRNRSISVLVVLGYSFNIQSCLFASPRQVWSPCLVVLGPSCSSQQPVFPQTGVQAATWQAIGVAARRATRQQPGGPVFQILVCDLSACIFLEIYFLRFPNLLL
jgi:hypothetical protein